MFFLYCEMNPNSEWLLYAFIIYDLYDMVEPSWKATERARERKQFAGFMKLAGASR